MNERIVKLFMQSVDSKYIPLPVEDHIPLWTEKFVELIVRECLNILDDEDTHDIYGKSLRIAAIRMKKHFGLD